MIKALKGSPESQRELIADVLDDLQEKAEDVIRDAYGNTLVFTAADSSGNWWGDSATQSNFGANEIIFCGYRLDPETENCYVRNRYYSPALGRWLTRDPIGYQGGINLYEYVGGGAAGNVHPEGAQGCTCGVPMGNTPTRYTAPTPASEAIGPKIK